LKPIYHVHICVTPKLQADARRIHDGNAAPVPVDGANNAMETNNAARAECADSTANNTAHPDCYSERSGPAEGSSEAEEQGVRCRSLFTCPYDL
jgi:hypothetical protein